MLFRPPCIYFLTAIAAVVVQAGQYIPLASRSVATGPMKFIVTMKDIKPCQFEAHKRAVAELTKSDNKFSKRSATGEGITTVFDHEALNVFSYSAILTEKDAKVVAGWPGVRYVEHNQRVDLAVLMKQTANPKKTYNGWTDIWHLARISTTGKNLNTYYYDSSAGKGVTIYVVDSGIDHGLYDFGGRASREFRTSLTDVTLRKFNIDRNGHGTTVATIAAGSRFGVAKKAKVIGISAADPLGRVYDDYIIEAISAAIKDVTKKGIANRAVLNLSLDARGQMEALKNAVIQAHEAGMFISVAAGNYNAAKEGATKKIIDDSLAGMKEVCTVGASDHTDAVSEYTMYGPQVDIFAPGLLVSSIKLDSKVRETSGSSISAAIVSGVGAYLLGLGKHKDEKLKSHEVCEYLKRTSISKLEVYDYNDLMKKTTKKVVYNGGGSPKIRTDVLKAIRSGRQS